MSLWSRPKLTVMASYNETLRTNSFTPLLRVSDPQPHQIPKPQHFPSIFLYFFFPFFSCSFFNFVSFWVPAFANNLTPFFYYHFVLFNQDFKTKNKKIRNYFPPTRLNFLDWSNLHNDSVNTFVVSTSRRWTLDSCYFFIFFDLFLGLDDDLRGRKSVVHAELRKRAK